MLSPTGAVRPAAGQRIEQITARQDALDASIVNDRKVLLRAGEHEIDRVTDECSQASRSEMGEHGATHWNTSKR